MRTVETIIEDRAGNVVGATTSEGDILLDDTEKFPRSQWGTKKTKFESDVQAKPVKLSEVEAQAAELAAVVEG